jgi:transcriptional regulator with XRE-family HTH domain
MPRAASYERLSVELLRALRGRRSQSGLSKRLGYRSNIVHRWETRQCWPSAARFLELCQRVGVDLRTSYARMAPRRPERLFAAPPASAAAVTALLGELRGRTPIVQLADAMKVNRFTMSKWLRGTAIPNLPYFLHLIDATSGRLLDFIATLCDPAALPSVAISWRQLQLARSVAYDEPWSHAVLRALQLERAAKAKDQLEFVAGRLGLDRAEVDRLLRVLGAAGQVSERAGRWTAAAAQRVDTSLDPERARTLKATWIRAAADRLEAGNPGAFAYSVFEVSAADLLRLREVQLQYLREMLSIIGASQGTQCVGLFCAQLLDLAPGPDNALAGAP